MQIFGVRCLRGLDGRMTHQLNPGLYAKHHTSVFKGVCKGYRCVGWQLQTLQLQPRQSIGSSGMCW